jgi:hypothetical protein
MSISGLPDVLFSIQKSQFGYFLGMAILTFCGHLGSFMTIWHILCSFGTLLPVFGILYQEKSGNPGQYSAVLTSFWRHFFGAQFIF